MFHLRIYVCIAYEKCICTKVGRKRGVTEILNYNSLQKRRKKVPT